MKNGAASDDVTIFYVDDDRDDLEVFTSIVYDLNEGFTIHTITDGYKAMHALDNPPPTPNILFLDLNMPGKNGFEVLQEIRDDKRLIGLPVIILSTSDDEGTIARCYSMGASYYIAKATDYEELRKSIDHALRIDWSKFKATQQDFFYKN